MEELLNKWKERHKEKGYSHFINDGIVDQEEWDKTMPKICFLLKEAYIKEDEKEGDLCEWLRNGLLTQMWQRVALYSYCMLNTRENSTPDYYKTYLKFRSNESEMTDCIKKIAVVNVKKSNGNKRSSWAKLFNVAKEDEGLLKEQINAISPDIIYCGNTYDLLRLIYSELPKMQDKGAEVLNINGKNVTVINYWHPISTKISEKDKCEEISKYLRQLLSCK